LKVELAFDTLYVLQMRTILYGKKAANLYTQAFVQNTQARALYQESEDTYYRANDAASYDDWRRARHQWDYFYNRYVSLSLLLALALTRLKAGFFLPCYPSFLLF
jgi:hypothetical protein